MSTKSTESPGLRFMRGRPRTRPPVRRLAVDIDATLFAALEVVAGADPYRVVVEEALRMLIADREKQSKAQGNLVAPLPVMHGDPSNS